MSITTCKPTVELAPLPLSLEINLGKVSIDPKNETSETIFKVTLPDRPSNNSKRIMEFMVDVFKRIYTINFDTDTLIVTLEDNRDDRGIFYKIDPAALINIILSHALTPRSIATMMVPIDGFCAQKLVDTTTGNVIKYSANQAHYLMAIGAFVPDNYYLIPFYSSKEMIEVVSNERGTYRLTRKDDTISQIVMISNERCIFTDRQITFPTALGQVSFNPREETVNSLGTLRAFSDSTLLMQFENLLVNSINTRSVTSFYNG